MDLHKLVHRSRSPRPAQQPEVLAGAAQATGLGALFQRRIVLPAERVTRLQEGLASGVAFYQRYNESRLRLAYESFDPEMRNALFELLFLLHVNDPKLSGMTFRATRKEEVYGVQQTTEYEDKAELYLEGAPAGVKGLARLSPVLREPFEHFVKLTFGMPLPTGGADGDGPIVSVQSVGSIGTIGHKSGASDLDLQVIYDLQPLSFDAAQWNDGAFRDALAHEHEWWVQRMKREQKTKPPDPLAPASEEEMKEEATRRIAKRYPDLHKYLITGSANYRDDLRNSDNQFLRTRLLHEMMSLIRRHIRRTQGERIDKQEALLLKRVERIQEYINKKYPRAEVYLFASSVSAYRAGRYSSSLEFKESSGSAYDLILKYETLMPGIQFTPTVPAHFAVPGFINDDSALYQRLIDYIDFRLIDTYQDIQPLLVDLGPTPALDTNYVAQHGGAVYWEAFKASSGNLPKATLNLLRYEMLLDDRFQQTIVHLVREPKALNGRVTPRGRDEQENEQALRNEAHGMPCWVLLDLEFDHPALLQDPWWMRYKALKIGFAEQDGVSGLQAEDRGRISKMLDLAFALHLRISDAFTKPGDTRAFDSHREQVLRKLLEYAFPPGTDKRTHLEHIFSGDVRAVNLFEAELREQFRRSLGRAQQIIARFGLQDLHKKNQEVKLWHHYYENNFQPPDNMVRLTIMNDLMIPRGRVRIGYKIGEGWYFQSVQRESTIGKRFDTFGILNHLPEEVTLVEKSGFLKGLAECIINGYYGIINRGALNETRTQLEFNREHMDLGGSLDNKLAFVRPDHVDRIMNRILDFFPNEPHHYLDFFRVDRRVRKVFVFLNLWKYGRLSILYRDTLNVMYCDEFDHPELERQAPKLRADPNALLSAEPVHESLDRFLRDKTLYVDEIELATWVNPNSVETSHSSAQIGLKEKDLANAFQQAILKIHPHLAGRA